MQPSLSIIIPVGRPEKAASTLCSIRDQVASGLSFEVVCAGHDISSVEADIPAAEQVRMVKLDHRANPATTRIRAIEHASGQWLLMVDDDVLLQENFFQALRIIIETNEYAAFGARLESHPHTYWSRCIDLTNFPVQQGARGGARPWLYSAALCMPRDLYNNAGGFDPSLDVGEDVDLCRRIILSGGQLKFRPELAAKHHHGRDDFSSAIAYMKYNGLLARQLSKNYLSHAGLKLGLVRHLIAIIGVSIRYSSWAYLKYPVYFPGVLILAIALADSLRKNSSAA